MKISGEGLSGVPGFLGSGLHCGIKKEIKRDLALIYSPLPCRCAGVFTRNRIAASSVRISREKILRNINARAIIINSGNANVCTGKAGERSSLAATRAVARALRIPESAVLIASTGKISEPLPIARIIDKIPVLAGQLTVPGCHEAADAILTTDTFPKKVTARAKIDGKTITVGGFSKGSGMIHPDMATMLAFLGTDAHISRSLLKKVLRESVDATFNSITVDTTSTNDMVLLLANGSAGNPTFQAGSRQMERFRLLVRTVCGELAKMIVRDGEGATKLISIQVRGAQSDEDAKKVAYSIAQSPLVKTAFFGEDANWGRIMAAIGCAGVPVTENRISLGMNGVMFVNRGISLGKKEERRVARLLKNRELDLTVRLNLGSGSAQVWTSDLSYDYVRINAAYRT